MLSIYIIWVYTYKMLHVKNVKVDVLESISQLHYFADCKQKIIASVGKQDHCEGVK